MKITASFVLGSFKTGLWFCLLALASIAYGQRPVGPITGVHGTSEKDSTMSFDFIRRLPPDTVHRIRHEEPDEELQYKPHDIPGQGAIIKREEHPVPPRPARGGGSGYAPLSPAPNTNFTGTGDISASIPPDVQGAAGPSYLVQMENEQTEIFTKTGTSHSTVAINTFWTSMSPSSCYDSRIRYDPYSQRWIAVTDDYSESSSSCFYIAVSTTSDPTGTWQFHKVRGDSTRTYWLDFPTLGFNNKWIVVTGNMYKISNNSYAVTYLWAFDKSSLYSNTVSYTRLNLSGLFTPQPATTYDSLEANEFFVATANPTAGLNSLYELTGNIGSESFQAISYLQSSQAWDFSPDSTSTGPQKGSTRDIDLDDGRIQSVVYRNGYLWHAHNAFFPPTSPSRCSVMWWQSDTLGNIIQRSVIDDSAAGISYAYPSIAVNSYNDAIIGYSSFGSNQYASADYSLRTDCDAGSTMEGDYVYEAGGNSYYEVASSTVNRWGDYSQAMLDPTDDISFWTVQEYASSTQNKWSTWWAEVVPSHTNGGAGTWTWKGGTSTDWFTACNWDKGTLPNSSSDVVIPGGTTYEPTITGATASCKTLTIASDNGAVLTIATSSSGLLTVAQ